MTLVTSHEKIFQIRCRYSFLYCKQIVDFMG